jgi:LysM repeat protein
MNQGSFITALCCVVLGTSAVAGGEPTLTPEQYIAQWKDVAIQQMQMHGIPASITLAQGLLESGNGNSELARRSNNHFGIKCHSDWDGKRVYHDDDRKGECFRKYKNAADSYQDHSVFLKKRRYEFLFDLRSTDYKGWAKGLRKAGYATDPKYPNKLIDLIERYDLHELDKGDYSGAPIISAVTSTTTGTEREDDSNTVTFGSGHSQGTHENMIKYLRAKDGDSFKSIAEELELRPNMIARWNDMDSGKKIEEGQVIFIQPKRSKARGHEIHHVRAGDSLWSISQQYGVKLKKLAQYNGISEDTLLSPGLKIHLKKQPRS